MTNDCTHEKITLDDLHGDYDGLVWGHCPNPECNMRFPRPVLKEMGYKLVNVNENDTVETDGKL